MCLLRCCYTGQVGCDFLSVGSGNTRPRFTLCLPHNSQTASPMAIRYVGSSLPSINMICLLFPSHPSSVFLSAVASDVLGLVCTCEKQLPRDPSSLFSTALFLFSLAAREFHATLHEPSSVPNSAVAPLSPDISVAFQRLRRDAKFGDQPSGNSSQRLVARVSASGHQPRLNAGLCGVSA